MFSNKRVLILGASGGIGREIAACFRNYHAVTDTPSHSMLDLADEQSIKNYFAGNDAKYDAMVYSAGINNPEHFENISTELLQHTYSVNTLGFISVCREILPGMKELGGGRIVVLSSLYGVVSRKKRLPYALSKHALIGAVQTMALEFAKYNILVNAVSPGFINTELTSQNNSPERIAELLQDVPLQRLGEGADIGEIAAFLCSDKNRYITGQNIIADGGILAGGWQDE